ncbi:MAG: VCBS repeat-containing protein [Planctomycetes bacterium]|nr:VCBS repeat-containing protein [Planctomycetota bacterium]
MSRRKIQAVVAVSVLGLAAVVTWKWSLPNGEDRPGSMNGTDGTTPAITSDGDGPQFISDLVRPGASANLLEDDPRADGWDTEAFSNAAGAQLKKLHRFITQHGEASHTVLAGLAADTFRCASLRPGPLREVYRGRTLRITRSEKPSQINPRDPRRGPSRLEAVLRELIDPFSKDQRMRVATKIVAVTNHGDTVSTDVLFQASGLADGGSLQQNAQWTCRWAPVDDDGAPPRLLSIEVNSYEEIESRSPGETLLVDCTLAVLGHTRAFREQLAPGVPYWLERLDTSVVTPTDVRSGVSIGDVNGDGLDDVYVCQPAGLPNRLFLQNTDGTVRDVAAEMGVNWLDRTRSALFLDLDNDGDQDLVVALGNDLVIHENDGRGRFIKRSVLPLLRPGNSLAAVDYDQDGDIDLFACVYYAHDRDPGQLMDPIPYYDARNGGRNVLWRNDISADGLWKFTDVTQLVGLDKENSRWSFAASWEDYDNDGDADLYVANDFGRNNLYRNDLASDGGRSFTDVAASAGAQDAAFGMSVSWADYNHDGWMDLYISNMFTAAGNRITYQRRFQPGLDEAAKKKYQYLARGNTLFAGSSEGVFRDVSIEAGVTMGRWSWASQFFDINNDGWEDLFVTNGYLTNPLKDDL